MGRFGAGRAKGQLVYYIGAFKTALTIYCDSAFILSSRVLSVLIFYQTIPLPPLKKKLQKLYINPKLAGFIE